MGIFNLGNVRGPKGEDGSGGGGSLTIDENTPIAENEAEAIMLGLADYEVYITSTGEIRYKLPTGGGEPTAPHAPTGGAVIGHTFTFTKSGETSPPIGGVVSGHTFTFTKAA